MMNTSLRNCFAALLLALPPITACAGGGADVRKEFRLALAAAENGSDSGAADSQALQDYILYPDLQALRLHAALRRAAALDAPQRAALDAQIAAFLDAHPLLPAVPELRRSYLQSLAERDRWAEFFAHYRSEEATPALVCQYHLGRIRTAPESAADELLAFWQDAPQMPAACLPAFEWLDQQQLLTPPVIERRARKALADGNLELADWLIRMLPAAQRPPLERWAALLRDPAAALARLAAQPEAGFEWDALLAAWSALARRTPERAAALLPKLAAARLTAAQHAELQRWIALGLAWDRRAEALAAFEALPESAADPLVHEWRIRAALWHGQHALAWRWLEALPEALAVEPRWMYWRARMLAAQDRQEPARQLWQALREDNGYYSLLAAWQLGEAYRPQPQMIIDEPALQAQLLERRGFARARELHAVAQDHWANIEWARATRDLEPLLQAQAARLASQWGWHLQAVSTLAALGAYDAFELSYPDAYIAPIRLAAEDAGLPPALIYAVMRQESLFHPRAVSPAGAYGLLQLLLPTAREVARRRGDPAPAVEDLLQPKVNIPLGATYLREMRARFDAQLPPSLAAYNAGPNAVARWLPATPLAADIWTENIPYNETRSYVQKVLWHMAVFHWRQDGEAVDPSPWLKPVGGIGS